MNILNEAFKSALPVIDKITEAGFEAYFVGGAIRDSILHRPITDIDISTSATPQEIKQIFPKTFDVGIQHGTVVVLHNNQSYEITTFRTESNYINYRQPQNVQFVRSLKEDLKRRDFTMNAMALSKEGKIIDYYDGMKHIDQKLIQTVGYAEDRFQEDALRMLRAIRFSSQLGFSIEDQTSKAILDYGHLLEHISVERKLMEMNKLFSGNHVKVGINHLISTSLYRFLPHFTQLKSSLEKMTMYNMEELSVVEKWTLLFYLASLNEEEVSTIVSSWKQPTKISKEIKNHLKWLQYREKNNWDTKYLYLARLENVHVVERIRKILLQPTESLEDLSKAYESLPIKSKSELVISGKDLLVWTNKRQGPWVKEVLQKIEDAVIFNHLLNDKNAIEQWLKQNI